MSNEKEQNWIFTFGCGQHHAGHYVKIFGTYGSAREQMFKRFGREWCFQYSEQEWKEMEADPKRFWPMETELEGK